MKWKTGTGHNRSLLWHDTDSLFRCGTTRLGLVMQFSWCNPAKPGAVQSRLDLHQKRDAQHVSIYSTCFWNSQAAAVLSCTIGLHWKYKGSFRPCVIHYCYLPPLCVCESESERVCNLKLDNRVYTLLYTQIYIHCIYLSISGSWRFSSAWISSPGRYACPVSWEQTGTF